MTVDFNIMYIGYLVGRLKPARNTRETSLERDGDAHLKGTIFEIHLQQISLVITQHIALFGDAKRAGNLVITSLHVGKALTKITRRHQYP